MIPLSVFKTDPFNRLGMPPWWSIQGLNLRPNDYKSFALTTALMDQGCKSSLNIITK